MYQIYQNTLTIPARALYEDLAVMSESNYKKQCNVGRINRVRMGKGLDNHALVEFDSIPERFRVEIVKILGYPPKMTEKNLLLTHYKDDYEAIDFFASFRLDDYRTLDPEKQDEYVKNAQMLNAVDYFIKDTVSFIKGRNGRRNLTDIWKDAAQSVADVQEQIGHTLPKSVRRLKEKLDDYKKDGYDVLVSENFGNKKAVKVKDDEQEALLRTLLRDHRHFDNEQIAMVYNAVAKIQVYPELTANTIGNYRRKWNLLVMAGTHGSKGFDNKVAMHVKRSAPTAPLVYWTVDGWDAELLFQKTAHDKYGKLTTTYHNRLTMVVVLDPFNKYPIGYSIGLQENAELIKLALRNAVKHTEELFGNKHKVLQIQSDNYASKKMTPFYEIVSEKYTPAKVGNAKSKVIEPFFKEFNKNYCQFAPNWSGQGVKAKLQPNDEYLNKIRHSFPDQEGCMMQLIRMVEMDRANKVEKFVEAYANAPESTKKLMPQKEFLLHFGETTGFTNRVSHNGLHVAINGRKMEYDSFDLNFRMNAHLDWTIKFDSNNLKEVLAYSPIQNMSFILQQKHEQPMAIHDRQEGDSDELQKVFGFNKEAKQLVLETQADDGRIVNQMFIRNPELNDTLAKMVLVDSKGQHKDQRNAKRLEPAQKAIKKQEAKEDKKAESDWNQQQENYLKGKININKYLDND